MAKKAPTLPFFIEVQDYHEFESIKTAMQLINPNIKLDELDPDVNDELEEAEIEFDSYIGIVYQGRKPSNKVITDMLSNEKTKIHTV